MATEAERSHNLLPTNWSSGEPVGWGFYLNPETQEPGAWCSKRRDDIHSPRWVMINLRCQLLIITMETGCMLRVYLRGHFQSDYTVNVSSTIPLAGMWTRTKRRKQAEHQAQHPTTVSLSAS